MYGDTALNLKSEVGADPSPITIHLVDELKRLNSWQANTINQIQDKLHNLINLRTPQTEQDKKSTPLIGDFKAAMEEEYSKMNSNCSKLEDLLAHLNKIV